VRHVEVLLFPRIPRVRCQVVGEFQVCGEDTEVFVCVHVFCVVLPSQEVGRKFYMYFSAIGNPSTFLNR
jgi:hypothetical protein